MTHGVVCDGIYNFLYTGCFSANIPRCANQVVVGSIVYYEKAVAPALANGKKGK
jgi:hypothetical protein